MNRIKLDIQKFASGSFECNPSGALQCKVEWSSVVNGSTPAEQSSLNRSTITINVYGKRTDSSTTTGTFSGWACINDTSMQGTGTWQGSISNNYQLIYTYSNTVLHNANGKKDVTIYGSVTGPSGTSLAGKTSTGYRTVSLDTIPRNATITSAPNFNDEANPTITYSNPLGTNAQKLDACISLTGARDDVPYRDISKTGTSYTFTLTEEERNTLRSATTTSNSRSVWFYVRTRINNTNYLSYIKRTFTIINGNPVFSDFEFEDVNPTTLALTGNSSINVNGYSNVKVTISTINKATAVKQATMSKYQFRVGNGTPIDIAYSDSTSVNGTINNASSGVYNVFAVDSRGNTTLVTKLASAEKNYQDLTIDTSSKVERNNGGVGTGAVLTYSGTIWNESFGQVSNAIQSATYEFKKTSDSTWITGTTNITPTVSGNTFSFTGTVRSDNPDYSFNLNYSYDFRITITDKLSTKIIQLTPMSSAVPNISLADDGVGIMCDYDESLGGLLQIGGEVYGDFPDEYSTTEVKTNKTWLGKPVYRKMYKVNAFPNATNSWVSSGVSNLETVVELRGYATNGNEQVFLSSAYSSSIHDCLVYDYVFSGHNQSIRIHTTSNRSSYSGYVWIEYTKTTD